MVALKLLLLAKVPYPYEAVVPEQGGPGGPLAPPIFGRPVNPIPTMGGRFCPPFTGGTPNVFHLPAPLNGKSTF